MSNALAVAAVTSTLRYVLSRALQRPHPGPVGGAGVTTLLPERLHADPAVEGAGAGINLFLFSVTRNTGWSTTAVPARRSDGSVVRRPAAALDLHYLLTCYGDDAALEPQRLLGTAVTALEAVPVLGRDLVTAAMDALDGDPGTAFLADADLADAVELVTVSPVPLDLDGLSKLWSVLFQTPYLLSVAYLATAVVMEAPVVPRPAPPVRRRAVEVAPSAAPRLRGVAVDGDPHGPVLTGSTLLLSGASLTGPLTRVRIGPAVLEPLPGATPAELRVAVGGEVPAGLHGVQVLHLSRPGPPGGAPSRVVATSNAQPVAVRPGVTAVAVSADDVTATVAPPVHPGQRATVVLAQLDAAAGQVPGAVSHVLPLVPRGAPPVADLVVPRDQVPAGTFLVRVDVDGVESLPSLVGDVYAAPSVTVPP